MHFFYAPDIIPPIHTLPAEESRHAVRVLRLGVGARLHLADGRGTLYETEIVAASEHACTVRVVAVTPDYGRRPYRLTLAVAPTKNGDRMEWLVEKATEVGLDALVPVECANSERRTFRPERVRRVAVSAMKQSLKASLPEIAPLTPFREVVSRPFDGVKLIAHCRDGAADARVPATEPLATCEHVPANEPPVVCERIPVTELLRAGADVLVLIGPEGDFTAAEVALALEKGFRPVSLGPSRLRTETAALVAVTAAYLANIG